MMKTMSIQCCRRRGLLAGGSVIGAGLALILALAWMGIGPSTAQAQGPVVLPCEKEPIAGSADGIHGQPVIDASGNRIAFWSTGDLDLNRSNDDGNIEIFLYNATDGRFIQITDSSGTILGGFNLQPRISADGNRIVFFSDRDLVKGSNVDGNFEIFVYDVIAQQVLQVTQTRKGVSISPSINKDGTFIAFASDEDLDPGVDNSDRNLEIFLADVRSASSIIVTQITDTSAPTTNDLPAIAGAIGGGETRVRIAYKSNTDGNFEIFVADVDANRTITKVQITDTADGIADPLAEEKVNDQPAINTKGDLVAFVSNADLDPSVGNADGNDEIFLAEIGSTSSVTLTQITDTSAPTASEQPKISVHDQYGTFIAFASNGDLDPEVQRTDDTREIFLYDGETKALVQLSQSKASSSYPSINSGGEFVAFDADHEILRLHCTFSDLAVEKTFVPTTATAGQPLTYTIVVTNNGPALAKNVQLTDTLPLTVTYSSGTAGCSLSSDGVTCDLADMARGIRKTLVLETSVKSSAKDNETITNTVQVFSDNRDRFTENNTFAVGTEVRRKIDLSVTKQDDPRTVDTSDTLTYTLAIVNSGPSDASGVVMTDTLPDGVSFVSARLSRGTCLHQPGSRDVICNLNEISAGDGISVTIVVQVVSVNTETLRNVARVSGIEQDTNPDNNTDIEYTTNKAQVDLEIEKRGPGDVVAGTPITYTLVVHNLASEPSDATDVVVTDTLPAAIAFDPVGSSVGCTEPYTTGTIICHQEIVSNGESITFTVVGEVDQATPSASVITNTAQVGSNEPEPNLANNSADLQTTVDARVDVAVIKRADPSPATAGELLTYTLIVSNYGPSLATQLVVTDVLPDISAVDFVTVTAAAATCAGKRPILCSIDALPKDVSDEITITVKVHHEFRGTITNTAAVKASQKELTGTAEIENNRVELPTEVVGHVDLATTKVASASSVVAGESLRYTITITNQGPSEATRVTLADTLPVSVSQVVWSTSQPGASCSWAGRDVACDLEDLAPAVIGSDYTAAVVLTATFEAGLDPVLWPTITNTASVTATENLTGVVDSEPVDVNVEATLQIAKAADPTTAAAGALLTYTVFVTNTGPSYARNVTVSDTLPVSVTFESSPDCGSAGRIVTCALGTLPVDQPVSATFTVRPDPALRKTITNTASVTATGALTTSLSEPVVTPIIAESDLQISKSANPITPTAGSLLTYTIVITNARPSQATGVRLTDTLPVDVTLVVSSTSRPGASCSQIGRDVTCDLGTLDPRLGGSNYSATVTLGVRVDPAATGQIVNAAEATANEPDPNAATTSLTTAVSAQADLQVAKSGSPDPVITGETLTYTLTYTNAGPSYAQEVYITDTLPAEVTYGGAVCVPPSFTCPVMGALSGRTYLRWYTPTLAARVNGTLTGTIVFTVTVKDNISGTISNDVEIASQTEDLVSGNNRVPWVTSIMPTVGFERDSYSVLEGAGTATITVTLNAAISQTVMVDYATTGDSAVAGQDYTDVNDTLTFDPGVTVKTFTVPITDDGLDENAETVNLSLTNARNSLLGRTSATLTITDDDDEPEVSFSHPSYAVGENAGPATITVTLSAESGRNVTVTYGTADGTAQVGSDYTARTGTLNFSPGVTLTTGLTVPITDDELVEGAETVSVTLSNAVNAVITGTGTTTLAIIDDDVAQVTVTATQATASEAGPMNGQFTISLTKQVTAPVAISFEVTGTATNGTDYVALSSPVTVPANRQAVTVTVTVTDDNVIEGDETVVLILTDTNNSRVTLGSPVSATVTITDDDTADLEISKTGFPQLVKSSEEVTYTLVITNNGLSVADSVIVTDTLPQHIKNDEVLRFSAGCAKIGSGGDPGLVTCSLGTLGVNQLKTITITVQMDVRFGGLNSVVVTNTAEVRSTVAPDSDTGNNVDQEPTTVTKLEADLAIAKSSTPARAVPGSLITYTIVVTNYGPDDVIGAFVADTFPAAIEDVSWSCERSETSKTSCTAADTGDISDTVNIKKDGNWVKYTAIGTLRPSVTVTVVNTATVMAPDPVLDTVPTNNTTPPDENVPDPKADLQISKTAQPDPVVAGETLTYTLTYTNAGPSYAQEVYITDTLPAEVTYGGAVCVPPSFTCPVMGASPGGIYLRWVTSTLAARVNGTVTGTIVFTVTVKDNVSGTISNDVEIASQTPDPIPGNNQVPWVTSIMPAVGFERDSYSVLEDAGTATITVTLNAAISQTVMVDYATSGDSAVAGEDYTDVNGTLTFDPGVTVKTFTIPITDDVLIEGPETVTLTLGNPINAVLGATVTATLTITDDDTAQATVTATQAAASETGPANGQFTISLTQRVATPVQVSFSVGGSAASGTDYDALSSPVTIPANSLSVTFPVTVTDDNIVEGDETVELTLTSTDNGRVTLGSPASATVTIADDDTAQATVTATQAAASEAGPVDGQFTISFSKQVTAPVAISFEVTGTATNGTDYVALSSPVTMSANRTAVTVTVTITDDSTTEGSETVVLVLTDTNNSRVTLGSLISATVTITDDEPVVSNGGFGLGTVHIASKGSGSVLARRPEAVPRPSRLQLKRPWGGSPLFRLTLSPSDRWWVGLPAALPPQEPRSRAPGLASSRRSTKSGNP